MSLLGRTFPSVVLAMSLALTGGAAQEDTVETGDALDALIEAAIAEMELEACAVVVAIGDEELHTAARGTARPGKRAEAGLDTPFEAGDFAHVWLTTVTMQHRAKGQVALDDELGNLLPDLVGEDCPVHVANLLSHTSGFADYTDFIGERERSGASYAELFAPVAAQDLITEPGECVAISPTNTLVLAALVEKLSGQSAAGAIQERIFDALDMGDSGYENGERAAAAIEAGSDAEGEAAVVAFYAAALRSSANDLARFQRALLDRELLDADDFELMTEGTRLIDGSIASSGMGLRRTSAAGSAGFAMGRDRGALAHFPEHDLTVAVVGRGAEPRFDRLALRLATRVIEAPGPEIIDLYLTEVEMRPYLGMYNIGCNTLIIRPQVGRIALDRTEEGLDVLLYQGAHRFVAQGDPELVLVFDVEGARARSFTLDDHGLLSIATRIDD